MTESEIAGFILASRAEFVAELIEHGESVDEATRRADADLATAFPGGQPGLGHSVFAVEADNQRVGHLWVGPSPDHRSGAWWVWDIGIDEPHRRRGFAKSAMQLAEEVVGRDGGTEIRLNVFGHNVAAQVLYRRLGYEVEAIRMRKLLSSP